MTCWCVPPTHHHLFGVLLVSYCLLHPTKALRQGHRHHGSYAQRRGSNIVPGRPCYLASKSTPIDINTAAHMENTEDPSRTLLRKVSQSTINFGSTRCGAKAVITRPTQLLPCIPTRHQFFFHPHPLGVRTDLMRA
ncbi:hypothetical protein L210DRAFT_3561187 [Boletus edulis BED1]|uniref:Secreted protein n=1 Tax=Boletus edulis BED1 TaxID=1328754 RepID=A0AAD4BHI0_BOLED|nr:hypothetical protein L210DRAFT_3561187 [Boletus edulis BED1]